MRRTRNQVGKPCVDQPCKENNENIPKGLGNKSKKFKGLLGIQTNCPENAKIPAKRKAEGENVGALKRAIKRSAFGDITNAIEKAVLINAKADASKQSKTKITSTTSTTISSILDKKHGLIQNKKAELSQMDESRESLENSITILSQELKMNKITLESSSYITASEGSPMKKSSSQYRRPFNQKREIPSDVEDFDAATSDDIYSVSAYAMDVFLYYKEREEQFVIEKYISKQPDVTRAMRSILVDWMVEVQENFELNHETLYLAVKIVDLYLSRVVIQRSQLQLVGSTAIFIACKFDERMPPYIDDFLYICDDAYKRKEMILLEMDVLKTLDFDLGVPLSYRFLRRYARCCKLDMETLTFARFILEMTLTDYEFVGVRDSALAAAALFLALNVKEKVMKCSSTFQYYSGYDLSDIYHLINLLHHMLTAPPKEQLKTIRRKYSHEIFFEVATIAIPEKLLL